METLIYFTDDFDDKIVYPLNIIVNENKYDDGSIYYYIEYLGNEEINSAHPFYNNQELLKHKEGDIILKNIMTEQMIKYLFMDETELDKYSGSTSATCYKKRIMIALTNFWD